MVVLGQLDGSCGGSGLRAGSCPGERGRNCITFSDLASEVIQVTAFTLPQSKTNHTPPRFKGRATRLHLLTGSGKVPEQGLDSYALRPNLAHLSKTATPTHLHVGVGFGFATMAKLSVWDQRLHGPQSLKSFFYFFLFLRF